MPRADIAASSMATGDAAAALGPGSSAPVPGSSSPAGSPAEAAGMVLGANWMGARAFTPTSGPGISLMSEWIGFGYFTEIPAVLFDVQRVGPSTGMPTRTQQCDLSLCAYASHGDTKHPCLFPADIQEAYEFALAAFDAAEAMRTGD